MPVSGQIEKILQAISRLGLTREIRLMEVCGTHTMSIARSGIRSLLPGNIHLLSGPGCPVCVTPADRIDQVLQLSENPGIVIATYGDMIRVPGSIPGDSLERRRAMGASVEVVYSAADAVDLAESRPDRQIVFLGVGFETTAPGTAAAMLYAKEKQVENFTVFSLLKTVEPALRALISSENFNVQGFLCPGHVASIIGERGFRFLPESCGSPAVISGFEAEDILLSVYMLLRQIRDGKPVLENEYRRAVSENGNLLAQRVIRECFDVRDTEWRGLGTIQNSGLVLKENYREFDAEYRFGILDKAKDSSEHGIVSACRCGEVITGRLEPSQCPLFGGRCTPEDPVGPCMVSSEGACAAAYKYMDIQWMK